MGKLPGINHLDAARALQKAGFSYRPPRQAHRHDRRRPYFDHPRHNPVNAFTMGGIVRDAGLTIDAFKALL